MLPTAIHFTHIFEEHEHIVCNDKSSTHIHESETKCEICSFNLASFNYQITQYPDLFPIAIPVKKEINFDSLLFHSFKITNTQLRAPPFFT